MLLSTLGVDAGASRDLRFISGGGLRPPGAAIARMRWRGTDLLFAGVTLIGNSAVRCEQVGELNAAIDDLAPGDLPTIISAEGADRPRTAAWQALVEDRVAVSGRVFVDGGVGVGHTQELDGNQLTGPLLVDLTLD